MGAAADDSQKYRASMLVFIDKSVHERGSQSGLAAGATLSHYTATDALGLNRVPRDSEHSSTVYTTTISYLINPVSDAICENYGHAYSYKRLVILVLYNSLRESNSFKLYTYQ